MDNRREFRFVANKVYTIPGRGTVVTGKVEKGSVSVGDEIGFIGSDGQLARAVVAAIEVSRRLVEEAQQGQEASLLWLREMYSATSVGQNLAMAAMESLSVAVFLSTDAITSPDEKNSLATQSMSAHGRRCHGSTRVSSDRTFFAGRAVLSKN